MSLATVMGIAHLRALCIAMVPRQSTLRISTVLRSMGGLIRGCRVRRVMLLLLQVMKLTHSQQVVHETRAAPTDFRLIIALLRWLSVLALSRGIVALWTVVVPSTVLAVAARILVVVVRIRHRELMVWEISTSKA